MRTLELGLVNTGFIFFALALLSTLFLGRFVCGWACHLIALQDLCGWIMKKCGLRPHPFRSRLLSLIPLALALYMFAWPSFKRLLLAPALEHWWPSVRADLAIIPFPDHGFTLDLTTENLWQSLPTPLVALPFLLVCGFASVYFLGAKGFCTYACPYGGFFKSLDRLAPARIVVNHDKCLHCGHCTAVCTSNVRVSDEVREFGMVVDPGCMKCLDCVSVCPNDALSYSLARPSILKGKPLLAPIKRVHDTTIPEDIALLLLFLTIFLSTRGAYGVIPMLMAVGLAAIGAFLAWKLLHLFRDPNVRFSRFQLKRARRLTTPGIAFATITLLAAAAVAHTGFANYHRWRADSLYDQLALSKHTLLDPTSPSLLDSDLVRARAALRHYRLASSISDGGLAAFTMPASDLRSALLLLALRDYEHAELMLRRVWARSGPADELIADLGRVILARSQGADLGAALALYEQALADHPEYWSLRENYATLLSATGRTDDALHEADAALARIPPRKWTAQAHARTLLTLGLLQNLAGKPTEALASLRKAAQVRPQDAVIRENLAVAILTVEHDTTAALAEATAALDLNPANHNLRFQIALLELRQGDTQAALRQFDELVRREPDNQDRRRAIADSLRAADRSDDARRFE